VRIRLLAAVLAGSLASRAAGQTDVYIGVAARSGELQWGIGMPPFVVQGADAAAAEKAGRDIRDVVRQDLLFNGSFKPVAPPSAEAASDPRASAKEWKQARAGFVLSGTVSGEAGKLAVTCSLLDLNSGEAILERYYRADASNWRMIAHQISDDVVKQVTGKSGIARTRIAFVNDQTGDKELYVVDYDGAGLRRLTNDRSIVLLPRWSPDRKRLLYTSFKNRNPDIYEFNVETGRSRVFSARQGLNLAGGYSPDGSQLVLTLSLEKNPDVYLMDLSDGSLRPLTHDFGAAASPTFSPDGEQVAFVSDRSGNPEVHILDFSTGRTQRLTRLNWCDSPSWSPTGEWIVFAGRANNKDPMDLFLVDITGTHVRQLTHGEGTNEDPTWSPDGRFIAFTSTRNGKRRLYVMNADGSGTHPVADIPGNSFTPAWSP